jgi:thiol-disulfide isomerase/thioredoxin
MICRYPAALAAAGLAFSGATAIAAPPPAPTISVTPADATAIKNAIAAQKGHVVVVNVWATWCAPCVAEFPALVRLQDRYRPQGLVVFAVSADLRKDLDTKVKPFLASHHADFPQYLQHDKDPEDFINAFDPKWQGDLPRTFVYDKSGRLVKELAGEQTDAAFVAAVKPLLK